MTNEQLAKKAAQARLNALTAIHKAGKGFSGSAMSVVEILVSLYYGELRGQPVMNYDVSKPGWEGQDYLVLSKGQAAPSLYAILADLGFFDEAELGFYSQVNSMLQSRPNMKVPGVPATMVSHGTGLSVAAGMAMALKTDRKPNRVYCVIGDGELQEGQIWEAAMSAYRYKLGNLVVFLDNNKVQSDGKVSSVMDISPIQAKFEAFNWQVFQVMDGHDYDQIFDAIQRSQTITRSPVLIWCHTVCAKGIHFAEGKASYIDAPLSEGELNEVIPKLQEGIKQSGSINF